MIAWGNVPVFQKTNANGGIRYQLRFTVKLDLEFITLKRFKTYSSGAPEGIKVSGMFKEFELNSKLQQSNVNSFFGFK